MSVLSEFSRLIGRCIDFLEASEAETAWSWATALHAARAIGADDLSEAAARVLAMGNREPSIAEIEFPTAAEAEEYRELCDHMMAIVRVIVGRSASAGREV